MSETDLILGAITLGVPAATLLVRYLLKTEARLSRVETKIDLILHHFGLNPGKEKKKDS